LRRSRKAEQYDAIMIVTELTPCGVLHPAQDIQLQTPVKKFKNDNFWCIINIMESTQKFSVCMIHEVSLGHEIVWIERGGGHEEPLIC
jgi:hypothetical protein